VSPLVLRPAPLGANNGRPPPVGSKALVWCVQCVEAWRARGARCAGPARGARRYACALREAPARRLAPHASHACRSSTPRRAVRAKAATTPAAAPLGCVRGRPGAELVRLVGVAKKAIEALQEQRNDALRAAVVLEKEICTLSADISAANAEVADLTKSNEAIRSSSTP
jgi:hypothetical protein